MEVGLVGVCVAVGSRVGVKEAVTVGLDVTVGGLAGSVDVEVGGGTSPGLVNRKAIRAMASMAMATMGTAYLRRAGICFSLAFMNVVTAGGSPVYSSAERRSL